ncbi:MAG: class I SAM-dependent methyltransferase, partial [Anaerolineales bacterium]
MTTPDPPSMSLLHKIQSRLIPLSETPYLDALVLISHVSNLTKSQLIANPKTLLTAKQNDQLELALEQLSSGTPLPYVLGQWEFYQLLFNINPEVLIPRPETEGLVDRALSWLDQNPTKNNCLELGTGSGCIAVALA